MAMDGRQRNGEDYLHGGPMKILKWGHASLLACTRNVTCFMDPVLVDPFEGGANTFEPPVRIRDPGELARRCDLVILSHEHFDHFSIPSLALFDRSCTVLYPAGAALIETALRRMAFVNATPLQTGASTDGTGAEQAGDFEFEAAEFGDLLVMPTPSRAPFPELGIMLQTEEATFLNLVDSHVGEAEANGIRTRLGDRRLDLLAATYQPIVEYALAIDALGTSFPYEAYGALLANVERLAPRAVIPGSCGFAFPNASWLNHRHFPITEKQFLRDVQALAPGVETYQLGPGDSLTLGASFVLERNAVPQIEALLDGPAARYAWRPDRGVPPLTDVERFGYTSAELHRRVHEYLADDLPAQLRGGTAAQLRWLRRMCRLGITWRLEVVYPAHPTEVFFYKFAQGACTPTGPDDDLVQIHTSILASVLVAHLDGKVSTYSAQVGLAAVRIFTRIYEWQNGALVKSGSAADEPLTNTLFAAGSDARFIDQELTRHGF